MSQRPRRHVDEDALVLKLGINKPDNWHFLYLRLTAALPEGGVRIAHGVRYPACEEVRVGLAVAARLETGDGDAAGGRSFRARGARRCLMRS